MNLEQFSMMNLLSADKARELCDGISNAGTGDRMLGTYDPATGFCLRVYLAGGVPLQWFIRGPLTLEQARAELLGAQHEAPRGLH